LFSFRSCVLYRAVSIPSPFQCASIWADLCVPLPPPSRRIIYGVRGKAFSLRSFRPLHFLLSCVLIHSVKLRSFVFPPLTPRSTRPPPPSLVPLSHPLFLLIFTASKETQVSPNDSGRQVGLREGLLGFLFLLLPIVLFVFRRSGRRTPPILPRSASNLHLFRCCGVSYRFFSHSSGSCPASVFPPIPSREKLGTIMLISPRPPPHCFALFCFKPLFGCPLSAKLFVRTEFVAQTWV